MVQGEMSLSWTALADGALTEASEALCRFLNVRFEQIRGFRWITAIHPEDRPLVAGQWMKSTLSRVPLNLTCRLMHSGGWTRMGVRSEPVIEQGVLLGWQGRLLQIDAETTSPLPQPGTYRLDALGNCTWASPETVALLGFDPTKSPSLRWNNLIHPADLARCRDTWDVAFANHSDSVVQYELCRRDGVRLSVMSTLLWSGDHWNGEIYVLPATDGRATAPPGNRWRRSSADNQ